MEDSKGIQYDDARIHINKYPIVRYPSICDDACLVHFVRRPVMPTAHFSQRMGTRASPAAPFSSRPSSSSQDGNGDAAEGDGATGCRLVGNMAIKRVAGACVRHDYLACAAVEGDVRWPLLQRGFTRAPVYMRACVCVRIFVAPSQATSTWRPACTTCHT